jgi:hypothetical protein
MDSHFNEIDDFFELCEYMGRKKYALMLSSPHIFDFFVRALYAGGEDITRVLNDRALNATGDVYDMYFDRLDKVKFRPGVDPRDILQMLVWMADGCMRQRQRTGAVLTLDDITAKFGNLMSKLKKLAYKEEYLT